MCVCILNDTQPTPIHLHTYILQHDWSGLISSVRDHRGMLNFIYRRGLKSANVEYINALASFASPNVIK